MIKIRIFTTKHNFKTGIISKFCFIIGLIFLIFSFILINHLETFIALSIISFAIGVILHILYLQFIKLDDIAKEIENTIDNSK